MRHLRSALLRRAARCVGAHRLRTCTARAHSDSRHRSVLHAPVGKTSRHGENMQAAQRSSVWLRRADRTFAPRCLLNHLGEDGALGSLLVAALLVYLAASSIASVRMARLARCTLLAMQDSTVCCSNDKRHRVRHCCPRKTPPCLPSWARRRRFFVRLERGRRWRGRRHVFLPVAPSPLAARAAPPAEVSENKSAQSHPLSPHTQSNPLVV